MKKRPSKFVTLLLCTVVLCCILSACGSGGADNDTSFTYVLSTGEQTHFYAEYEDNPAVQYWLSKEWDADGDGKGKKVSIDFITLPAGAESDNINTMLGTGEYPMILDVTYSSEKPVQLYEEGIALDITEYVEQYMPNYRAWMEAHPELGSRLTNMVNGERRYLGLYAVNDAPEQAWGGYCYRRDWIVKYGTNPETGAAFSGHWDGDNWIDDVVFPSGNTDPIYISDWEWMLDIFAKAIENLGITDGYALSIYYPGYLGTGDFMSGFGAPSSYYIDENGVCQGGFETENFRAYLECMNTWYANGWIDPQFDERASDMFYMVNTAATFAGKVGAWYGQLGTLGNAMDNSGGDTSNLTNGIVVAGAPQPINDIYGTDECKYQEPFAYYANSLISNCVVFTNKCEGMDLPTLFTAIDYLYEEDGGAMLKAYGLSAEQVEEFDCQWYRDRNLAEGTYTVGTDENGNTTYTVNPVLVNDQEGLESAAKLNRTIGLSQQKGRQYGYPESKQHWIDMWMYYDNTGSIGNEITSQFTTEQQEVVEATNNYVNTYMNRTIPRFVNGDLDPTNDKDWGDYCATIVKYKPYEYCDFVNEILGN